MDQSSFTETGGGALNLAVTPRTTSTVQSQLGARFNMMLPFAITSDFKLAWGHEFENTGRLAVQSFAGIAGTSFTVAGASVPGDSAILGLGFTAPITPGGYLYLRYDGDIASQAESNAVTAGLRLPGKIA